MKKTILYCICLIALWSLDGCKKDNFPGARVSPYIAPFDLRSLYNGKDVTLTTDLTAGAEELSGIVVSDHSGGNFPTGILAVQADNRLNKLRGIAVDIGADAAKYKIGDAVTVRIIGGLLTRAKGLLEITGINGDAVTKVSSGNPIAVNRLTTAALLANPQNYECTQGTIVKGSFDPLPTVGEVLSGDKLVNDGFGSIIMKTDPKAIFADSLAPALANYTGVILNEQIDDDSLAPRLYLRTAADVQLLNSEITIPPVIIAGFISDVKGGDGNYEYVQFLATQDIDFGKTPFALVATNNANASVPTGPPVKGWATGQMRTYKINMFSGTVKKGQFFYVGGAGKEINGSGSTSMSSSNWIRAFDYTKNDGDGFGNATGGLFANSGNAFGMAVFADSVVTEASVPVDVVFVSTGGSLYSAGPPERGYRIANNDFYDIVDPISLTSQAYYHQGTNTLCFSYNPTDIGYFYKLGGIYSLKLARWTKARSQTNVTLTKQSQLPEIEGEGATILEE